MRSFLTILYELNPQIPQIPTLSFIFLHSTQINLSYIYVCVYIKSINTHIYMPSDIPLLDIYTYICHLLYHLIYTQQNFIVYGYLIK